MPINKLEQDSEVAAAASPRDADKQVAARLRSCGGSTKKDSA
jgi:hypothetical protein